ncbi:MAG: response regulator, partial [Stellaceae bacterium]
KGIAPLMPWRASRAAPCFNAKVLVVEDNPVNQEVVTGLLGNMDCRVATAVNGKCAVELFAEQEFDLVLMDCEMPVMDGFEAARRIREVEAQRSSSEGNPARTPIVALTAHALAEIRERCLRSGMDDFLVKPFDELQIAEMLRQWIPACERAPREKLVCAKAQDTGAVANASAGGQVIDAEAIARIRAIPGNGGASLFERVVAQFTDTAPALAATIRAQCEADDSDALWRTAHSLKSSAAALGAGRLSQRCAEIEAVAKGRGAGPVRDLLDALDADLAAAQNGLRELVGAEHV